MPTGGAASEPNATLCACAMHAQAEAAAAAAAAAAANRVGWRRRDRMLTRKGLGSLAHGSGGLCGSVGGLQIAAECKPDRCAGEVPTKGRCKPVPSAKEVPRLRLDETGATATSDRNGHLAEALAAASVLMPAAKRRHRAFSAQPQHCGWMQVPSKRIKGPVRLRASAAGCRRCVCSAIERWMAA